VFFGAARLISGLRAVVEAVVASQDNDVMFKFYITCQVLGRKI